ncbi:hypothetical protein [Iodidimonas sp. SYSU 1G8]|uniref:hypothetical protein n=1 Tax=Iodidimonas sp. SYSU 1G8 TaxID=3133967 RepID=UPI0031FE5148
MRLRRRIGFALVMALVAGAAYLAYRAPQIGQLAVDISGKWACQCRYIDGGSEQSCMDEDPVGFTPMDFTFDAAARSVTTSIWGLVDASARYEPGIGCVVR